MDFPKGLHVVTKNLKPPARNVGLSATKLTRFLSKAMKLEDLSF